MTLVGQLFTILLLEITVLSVLTTAFQVDFQSTVVLLIFNALFISLLFQLHGSFTLKLGLIAVGNVLGTVWNFCFHVLILATADSFVLTETTLKIIYNISYPLLNSVWVISFWSLSLTFLHFHERMPQ